ncbi:MAG: phosphatase PAP2 family protein [Gemmatimonadales bacterium]
MDPTQMSRAVRMLRAWRVVWPPALVVLALMITALPATGPWALAGAMAALLVWRREGIHQALMARYLAGFLAFVAVRALADDVGMPLRLDYPILLDQALFGTVPTVAWQAHRTFAKDVLATALYLSYFLLPPTALVLCWRRWPDRLPRYVSATLLLFAVAAVSHILLPTAPPWVAAAEGRLPPVTQIAFSVFGERNEVYAMGQGMSGNLVAAMPSVHLGIATLVMLALWGTPLRWLGRLYVPAMLWAVVYGGEHYACDGLAGIALGALCWRTAHYLEPAVGRGNS